MARRKVDEVDKSTDFYEYMFSMRKNLKFIDALVKLLEDMPDDTNLSQDFCISYVITFLKEYCENDDDYELALASCGFLEGFSYKKYKSVQVRTTEYWKYACKYEEHEFIRTNWTVGTALTKLKDEHIIIIGYLDEKSQKAKAENNGKLGLLDEVPEELAFPKPRIIKEIPVEQSYRADASTSSTAVGGISANKEMSPDKNVLSGKLDLAPDMESGHTENKGAVGPEDEILGDVLSTATETSVHQTDGLEEKVSQQLSEKDTRQHSAVLSMIVEPQKAELSQKISYNPLNFFNAKLSYLLIGVSVVGLAIFVTLRLIVLSTNISYTPIEANPTKLLSRDRSQEDGDSIIQSNQQVINLFAQYARIETIPHIIELINSAQEPLVCYDESGEYDIDGIYHQITDRIMSNPFYGDMVIRGLMEADTRLNYSTINSTVLLRYTGEMSEAMELPVSDFESGMSRWLVYANNQVFPNEDYLYYADKVCSYLDGVPKCGIHKMQSICNMQFISGSDPEPIRIHAIRNDEQLMQEALILQYKTMGGYADYTIGFSLEDGHFIIYDEPSFID